MTSTDSMSGDLLQLSGSWPTIACTDRVKGCHPNGGIRILRMGRIGGGSSVARDRWSRNDRTR